MLIRGAEIAGRAGLDLRTGGERILEIGRGLAARPGEPCLDAAGGAVIPGLHDHHIHLLALAAALTSVPCGPPEVSDRAGLERALGDARPDRTGWLRGVGYHESVAGRLDRRALDALHGTRPLRVLHRSGAMWFLNSAALAQLDLEGDELPAGVERDEHGAPNGRLFRLDRWLRERLPPPGPVDLAAVGQRLAARGVTGVTDATPGNDADTLALFGAARTSRALPQRIHLMGGDDLPGAREPALSTGALKVLLDENALPPFDELTDRLRAAHRAGRAVAVHCVTRTELVFAVVAFETAGARPGDRIEHAAVAPPDVVARLARLPVTAVVQPGFVLERGDEYLAEVEGADLPWLHRCRGLLEAGVAVAAGTDAPFGEPDPWRAMRAAVERRTRAGRCLGADEGLTPEAALALFTSPAAAPGAAPRRVAPGAPADLVVLRHPWARVRERLSAEEVAATVVLGVPLECQGTSAEVRLAGVGSDPGVRRPDSSEPEEEGQ